MKIPRRQRGGRKRGSVRPVTTGPTAELLAQRRALSGDERVGTDFPLDILVARAVITDDEKDEGVRFAILAWSIYGFPLVGCQSVYERLVAAQGDPDLAPRRENEGTAEEDKRRIWQKAQMERMRRAIGAPDDIEAVRACCQFAVMPPRADFAALRRALAELVRLRARGKRRRAAEPDAPPAVTRHWARMRGGWTAGRPIAEAPPAIDPAALARAIANLKGTTL